MSRSALGNVGKLTSKMPMNMINQFSENKNVPLADVTKKIAVGWWRNWCCASRDIDAAPVEFIDHIVLFFFVWYCYYGDFIFCFYLVVSFMRSSMFFPHIKFLIPCFKLEYFENSFECFISSHFLLNFVTVFLTHKFLCISPRVEIFRHPTSNAFEKNRYCDCIFLFFRN